MKEIKLKRNLNGIAGLCILHFQSPTENNQVMLEETYSQKFLFDENLETNFVQENEVYSKKGVLRGLHINLMTPQEKLIRVVSGSIYDVVVDLRKNSSTYMQWCGVLLSDQNRKQLYIPKGMAHGYYAVEEAKVIYKVTSHYKPNEELGIAWNSDELRIEWPFEKDDFIISEKDKDNKAFDSLGW